MPKHLNKVIQHPFLMIVMSAMAAGGAMCVLFYVLQFIILGEGR